MDLHVYVHMVQPEPDTTIITALHDIQASLARTETRENTIMADLSVLTADVAANGDAVASAVTLLEGLSAALAAAGTDPVALAALADQLSSQTAALAQAVVANTPAAPAPVEPPVV